MGRTSDELSDECKRLGDDCLLATLEREQPAHAARVSPFALDVNETTNRELASWLGNSAFSVRRDRDTRQLRFVYDASDSVLLLDTAKPYGGLEIRADESIVVRPGYEDVPVVQITWDAARRYCAFRGKRLPSEAEREFAARGATSRRFPWGDDAPRCEGVVFGRLSDEPSACRPLPGGAQPVSAGDQDWSPERIHGLAGNVSEWVEDAFAMPYYGDCGDCVDPVQESSADAGAEFRIIRGSAWSSSALFARSSGRGRWDRRSLSSSLGVRCALSTSDQVK